LAAVVSLATCTETESPAPRSPNEQCSICEPTAPVTEHEPGPLYAGLIDQSTPLPAGSGSVNTTFTAVPLFSSSAVAPVMVKPIGSPASTVASSAVFVIDRLGASTTIVALSCTSSLFVADAVAVFGYEPALSFVVSLTM